MSEKLDQGQSMRKGEASRDYVTDAAGMTMDDLRSLNYDLSNFLPADKIPTGLQICIFPDTCNE